MSTLMHHYLRKHVIIVREGVSEWSRIQICCLKDVHSWLPQFVTWKRCVVPEIELKPIYNRQWRPSSWSTPLNVVIYCLRSHHHKYHRVPSTGLDIKSDSSSVWYLQRVIAVLGIVNLSGQLCAVRTVLSWPRMTGSSSYRWGWGRCWCLLRFIWSGLLFLFNNLFIFFRRKLKDAIKAIGYHFRIFRGHRLVLDDFIAQRWHLHIGIDLTLYVVVGVAIAKSLWLSVQKLLDELVPVLHLYALGSHEVWDYVILSLQARVVYEGELVQLLIQLQVLRTHISLIGLSKAQFNPFKGQSLLLLHPFLEGFSQ